MTNEQLKDLRDAINAHLDGKKVQYKFVNDQVLPWNDVTSDAPCFDRTDMYLYRPKPEPKTRPWSKPDDVPGPVCWMQRESNGWPCLVTEIDTNEVAIGGGGTPALRVKYKDLATWQYSTDRKTWHPCVVTED